MDPSYVPAPPSCRPQPFEIALIRKLESKTKSVRAAFLLLDIDCDGLISPSDLRTVLHNECGIDLTKEQEDILFSRFPSSGSGSHKTEGLGYSQFAKYFNVVSGATFPASESGFGAAVGFHQDGENKSKDFVDHELPIQRSPLAVRQELRRHLRSVLSSHSSRTHEGSGMKETTLFLSIDVHKSGKVTMQEFLGWLKSVGTEWTMDELKCVVLGVPSEDDDAFKKKERERLEKHLFGSDGVADSGSCGETKEEAGMTEHEFATFVESLDADCGGCAEGYSE